MTKEEMTMLLDMFDERLDKKLDEKLEPIKASQTKIELVIENEIKPNIKLISEGHGDLVKMQKQTLEKIDQLTDKFDKISDRVVVLEMK